jgi:hypothetical protein
MRRTIRYSDERELPVEHHEQPMFIRRYDHRIIKQNRRLFCTPL